MAKLTDKEGTHVHGKMRKMTKYEIEQSLEADIDRDLLEEHDCKAGPDHGCSSPIHQEI